jgi:hypothetical protein
MIETVMGIWPALLVIAVLILGLIFLGTDQT